MVVFGSTSRLAAACLALLAIPRLSPQATPAINIAPGLPSSEALTYSVEWRLIYAGNAQMTISPEKGQTAKWESKLHLESAGLVSKLYKLNDNYHVELQDQFCATDSVLDAIEGKRHHETLVTFNRNTLKASYLEKDLLRNAVIHRAETDIPACVSDIAGALYKLRTLRLEPGQTAQLAVSDGKKLASARVEAQEREQIQTKAGTFKTIRYEAYVFNGVLFKRNARLLVWITDDARRLPVQIRARMSFPVGNITLQLEKEEH